MDNFIGDNINALRIDKGLSQEQLAEIAGVGQTTVSAWECGSSVPRKAPIVKICNKLDVEYDDIMSKDNGYASKVIQRNKRFSAIPTAYSYHVVPVLGNVAAGEWREVYEQQGEVVSIPDEFADSHPRAFGVKPCGESMNLLFRDDEIAICDPDLEVRDGSVALVGVNGDEATIKRVYFAGNTIVLHAETTMEDEYPDMAINVKDPASPPVHLIGEVFWKTLPAKPIRF